MNEMNASSSFKLWFLVALLLFFISACAGTKKYALYDERDFQEAFNRVYFQGRAKSEVQVKYGRIDLLTDEYVIEVDRLDKFHEAIGQALHYAKETGKKPAIAIFILDHEPGDKEKLKYVRRLCDYYKIKVWYINEELAKAKRK